MNFYCELVQLNINDFILFYLLIYEYYINVTKMQLYLNGN